jgi:hypothetical protein
MRIIVTISVAAMLPLFAVAQTPPATTPAPAASPAKSIGMYVYPKSKQSADLQLKDETDCYASAKQSSGVDPQAPPAPAQTQTTQENKGAPKGGAVKGSAKGAAGGAAIGAVAGDAGTGAAVGATAGAMAGRRAQKKANKAAEQQAAQAQQQAQAQAGAQHQASLDSFKRAFSACMDARGYSVQ